MELLFKIGLFFLAIGVMILLQFLFIRILKISNQIEIIKAEKISNTKNGIIREYIHLSFKEFISDKKSVVGLVLGAILSIIGSILVSFFFLQLQ